MLRLNREIEYCLISLIALSRATDVISARELSVQLKIPFDILSKILQRSGQYGLVDSVQGPKGGYRLSRELKDITLDQVVEAMDGPVRLVPCGGNDTTGSCDRTELCLIRPGVGRIQDLLVDFLKTHTLQEIALAKE